MPRSKAFDEAAVLEKAKNLFWQKGYEATSMEDLVNELGISRSSLYDTFGDKEKLYCKTLNIYCSENVYTLIEKALRTNNPLEFIKDIFSSIITDVKKDADKKGCYVVNALIELINTNSKVAQIVEENNTAFEKMIEQLIIKGQHDNSIQSKKPAKQLARFLFTTICGIKVSAKANTSAKNLREVADVALEVLQY
jgi:TetR/AcrR family transcriptional regulator, transcriptional repressor for nem operon